MAQTATDIFVGIDAGTTGGKVALFDARGNELGSGYCEYPCIYPHPGWVEQDVGEVWRGICRALERQPGERDGARAYAAHHARAVPTDYGHACLRKLGDFEAGMAAAQSPPTDGACSSHL